MMKRIIFSLLLLIFFSGQIYCRPIDSRAIISLEECWVEAEKHHPSQKDKSAYEQISKLNRESIGNRYLPELSAFGQAQYQSDVTKIDIKLPTPGMELSGLPEIPKDQYKAGLNLSQTIWDGGLTSSRMELEELTANAGIRSTEAEIYSVRSQILEAYFTILKLKKREEFLRLSVQSLESRLLVIDSRVKNGVLLKSYSDILNLEIMTIRQSLEELKSLIATAISTLSELSKKPISTESEFTLPDMSKLGEYFPTERYEISAFDENRKLVNGGASIIESRYLPVFAAFGQAAFARPGLNMFDSDLKGYYIFGIKANWNIDLWGLGSIDKQVLKMKSEMIDTKEDNFRRMQKVSSLAIVNAIESLRNQVELDRAIVSCRGEILRQYNSQVEHGIITPSEYVTQFNAELQSKISLELKQIDIIKEKIKYLILWGRNQGNID